MQRAESCPSCAFCIPALLAGCQNGKPIAAQAEYVRPTNQSPKRISDMSVFESPDFDAHEEVAFFEDKAAGLKAIIAVHSTALGPACGGTRMYPYANGDAAATDVLRLSRGMSYKNAMANLPLGGGKAVIIGDPACDKTEKLFAAYANAVNAMGGRYITAMDVGVVPKDMPLIARGTKHIAGYDMPGKPGDSGPATALGVYAGLKAAVKFRLGIDTTKGKVVAIQGLGKVGMSLAENLYHYGAKLKDRDILYAPDYVTNGGGIIRVAGQIFGWSAEEVDARVRGIADTMTQIFAAAEKENAPTNAVVDRIAQERIATRKADVSQRAK